MLDTNLFLRAYASGSSMLPHEHDEVLLSIVVQGSFKERVGRAQRDYARGHVALLPAGLSHAQEFGPRGVRQVHFRLQTAWIEYLTDCGLVLDRAPHNRAAIFRHLGDRLAQEIRLHDTFSSLACEGLMLEVIAALAREAAISHRGTRPPTWLNTACEFMQDNVQMPLTLAQIAAAAGRHEIHLAREFRRYFGASVGEHLRRRRIEQAAHLLQRSKLSFSEIAFECGFSSHSHLCRTFLAYHGMTPSQYRLRTRDSTNSNGEQHV